MNMNLGDTGLILAECRKRGLLRNETAYVLATAYWETARTMEPVREAFWLSEEWRRANLRYYPWYGRGYVQLTWENNYRSAGERLGIDLTANPDVVMQPEIAVQILVRGMVDGWFTGRKLADYISLQRSDFVGARRIVNGTDKAQAIAELARDYDAALLAMGYGVDEPRAPIANERRDGTPARQSPAESRTILSQIVQWAGTGGTAVAGFFAAQDPMVKVALIGLAVVAIVAGGIVFRERLRKWAGGDR